MNLYPIPPYERSEWVVYKRRKQTWREYPETLTNGLDPFIIENIENNLPTKNFKISKYLAWKVLT